MAMTPMMRQYLEIKENIGDAILFFRLGDFYEMFMEDAVLASGILEITLTARDAGMEERIPMCGIPYHAAGGYIRRLVSEGHKVAICEQVEDPKTTKGIVKREVVRIITPGTLMDEGGVLEKENNYIAALVFENGAYGLAYADLSTGEFKATHQRQEEGIQSLIDELSRLEVREVVVSKEGSEDPLKDTAFFRTLHQDFQPVGHIANFDDEEGASVMMTAGSLLYGYLKHTQKGNLSFLDSLEPYSLERTMQMDAWTRKNLELTRNLRTGESGGTLLSVLDKTRTAFGGRLLKRWLEQPLLDIGEIHGRQEVVDLLYQDLYFLEQVRNALKGVYDIERLLSRLAYGRGGGRDLLSLKQSLLRLEELKTILVDKNTDVLKQTILGLGDFHSLTDLLERAISENAPIPLKEGELIREGYHPEVDEYRKLTLESKEYIRALEAREKERLGIKTLKVGYNKVFGYYIEISKSMAHLAPAEYIRKQTIAGGERYINEELKELEYKIIHSKEKLGALEYELFLVIRERVLERTADLKLVAATAGRIDVLASFAHVAGLNGYVRPTLGNGQEFKIINGRHPVVEKLVDVEGYVPNDFHMDGNNLAIITGPNMAGKSTFIRMLATLSIMAQCGSFVPADSVELGVCDRVFARVGASDDLGSGQSTFMVEMNEVASILREATDRSLIILDEVGRGTSTLDGLSIAWAVSEYLVTKIKARTVFATHYHELIELEKAYDNIVNLSMAVQEYKDQVVFLRKVVSGGADKSYGIHVARMAGLPAALLKRAEEQMDHFERNRDLMGDQQVVFPFVETENPVLEALADIRPNELTPLEALELVYALKEKSEGR